MNTLAYKLIVDKTIKRKITIINTLSENRQPTKIDELVENLKISKKTLLVTISQINQEDIPGIHILLLSKNEIILKVNNPFEIRFYIDHLLKNSPLFTIIEFIYSGKIYTIQELSDILYISESGIRKHLELLKRIVREYSLTIQLTPVDITGNETDIRYFYFQYFQYAHETSAVPLRPDQLESLYNTISSIHNEYGFVLNLDYHRIAHLLAVSEQRISLKHSIYLPPSIIEKYITSNSYLKFKQAFFEHFKDNPILNNLSEKELIHAFIVRLDSIIYEPNLAFYMDDFTFDLAKYDSLINNFFQNNNLHLGINNDLKFTLQAYLSNLSFLSDVTPLFQKTNEGIQIQISQNYETLKNNWYELLVASDLNFKFPMDIAVSLTLITVAQTYLFKQVTKRVLYVFTGEPATINYYKYLVLKVIPQNVQPFFVFNKPLNNTLLEKYSTDICVHNFSPQEKLIYCQSIQLSDVPKESEWSALLNILYS